MTIVAGEGNSARVIADQFMTTMTAEDRTLMGLNGPKATLLWCQLHFIVLGRVDDHTTTISMTTSTKEDRTETEIVQSREEMATTRELKIVGSIDGRTTTTEGVETTGG
jgi:hypothetical protein